MKLLLEIVIVYLLIGTLLTWLLEYRYDVVSESEFPIAVILYGIFGWGYEVWRLKTRGGEDGTDQEEKDETGT